MGPYGSTGRQQCSDVAEDFANLRALEAFLRIRLSQALPGAEAQRRLAPQPPLEGWSPDDRPPHARRAAALILLYPTERGISLPLTVRHHGLPYHAGQISLPGGRIDEDESAEQAAVRETWEEIGVPPGQLRVVGALSSLWVIVSNHLLQPFVAVSDERPDFRLAEREVSELVEVPLSHFREDTTLAWSRRMRDGVRIDVPHFSIDDHQIWGATAMVLAEFLALWEMGQ